MYNYTDYLEAYGRIMQFNKNKFEPVHRWYPFVEGYSKEFIQSIINELESKPELCLEPFSGSGTTALELQDMGIQCYSFEVNPLMFLIARVKLEKNYKKEKIEFYHKWLIDKRKNVNKVELKTEFITLFENDNAKKWNYHRTVAVAIEKLRLIIEEIDDEIYRELFKVALASILLDVSNLYRNGKCLSYKKEWKDRILNQEEVFERFDNKIQIQLEDIENRTATTDVSNKGFLFNEDSRQGIDQRVENNSIDLVITSPPYLNSRDYTDTYMLELKTMGFTSNINDIRDLREKTLRSHVQIKWQDETKLNNTKLTTTLDELINASNKVDVWNDSILDMIRLYFVDISNILNILYNKLKKGGKVYFNVSNSAYFNVLVDTLEICSSIAEYEGFNVLEIRKARYLKTSPQQQDKVGKLLEGVILLEK